jgi:hypothetical protein
MTYSSITPAWFAGELHGWLITDGLWPGGCHDVTYRKQ